MIAFCLAWLLPELPLRTTSQAPRPRSGPRRAHTTTTRCGRWSARSRCWPSAISVGICTERLAARAGLDLDPPELWLLARLGERAPLTETQLAEELQGEGRPIGGALEELRRASLVESRDDGTIALTTRGRDDYEKLVEAKCAGLRELLAGWHPDQQPELQRLVDRLGRDLVSEIPTPA